MADEDDSDWSGRNSLSSMEESASVDSTDEELNGNCSISIKPPWAQLLNAGENPMRMLEGKDGMQLMKRTQDLGPSTSGLGNAEAAVSPHVQAQFFQKTDVKMIFPAAPKNINVGNKNIIDDKKVGEVEKVEVKSPIQIIRSKTEQDMELCVKTTVETRSVTEVMQAFENGSNVVIITGQPGDGKSTVAQRVLNNLHNQRKEVLHIIKPDDLLKITPTRRERVILLDGIWGYYTFEQKKWKKWEFSLHTMLAQITMCILLIVGNKVVVQALFDYIQGLHVTAVTVDISKITRTLQEKENIVGSFETKYDINVDEMRRRQICEWKYPGFPKLCELFFKQYKSNRDSKPASIFQLPTSLEIETVTLLMKQQPIRHLFQKLLEHHGEWDTSNETGDLGYTLSDTAKGLDGTCLNKNGTVCTFIGQHMYVLVASTLWEHNPRFVIENGSMVYIRMMLRLQSQQTSETTSQVLFIPENLSKYLVIRFASEICKGNIYMALSHSACTWAPFAKQLIESVLKKNKSNMPAVVALKDASLKKTFPYLATSNGSYHVLKLIMIKMRHVPLSVIKDIVFGMYDAGAIDALKYLVDKRIAFEINVRNENGRTPVMIAADKKHEAFVMQLLVLKPDINASDFLGRTVLHYFCENGLAKATKEIISSVSDMNRKDVSGHSPLFSACEWQYFKIVKQLVDKGARVDAGSLHEACKSSRANIITLLIAQGASVTTRSENGDSLLHSACEGSTAVIEFLLERGVDINIRGFKGRTPLDKALGFQNTSIADYLKSKGAKTQDHFDPMTPHSSQQKKNTVEDGVGSSTWSTSLIKK
ncbi:uncharacterized protein LOC124123251 isoform X2 [Haliotis rufescens]|uniref:uncharacterized protein LOC124123251 isoform X2 n=1 Tax=Haliotis rufescens TaxID=6454 RepID=UPI00201F2DB7|nr:uncharacterized protein LOC124123251 isoform X2 [Haliotis rufescens]